MERVRLRLASGLIALLALLSVAAVARAQSERPKSVELVYRDYRDDGVIDACDHTKKALQKTLDQLPAEADIETPDLRPALEAAIEQVEQDECEPEPTPTPEPTSTPAPVTPAPVTPAPAVTPPPVTPPSSPDSSNVAPLPGGGGGRERRERQPAGRRRGRAAAVGDAGPGRHPRAAGRADRARRPSRRRCSSTRTTISRSR